MNWVRNLSVVCPESLVEDANHLAGAIGMSLEDSKTFKALDWEKDGVKYSAIQTLLKPAGVDALGSEVVRPDYDTDSVIDLVKAANAQGLITFTPDLNKISCSFELGLKDFAYSLGLNQLPPEEEV